MLLLLVFSFLPSMAMAGVCPSYPIIRDFNFNKYLGLWFQQDKQQEGWSTAGRCWQSLYTRDARTGHYKMTLVYQSTITRSKETYESELTLSGPAKRSVVQYSIPYTFMEDSFQVIATDYTSYSIEYQCSPNGILPKTENVFLLTRDRKPSAVVMQKAYAIMHHYGLDLRKLERVDQTCRGLSLKGIVRRTDIVGYHRMDEYYPEEFMEDQQYYTDFQEHKSHIDFSEEQQQFPVKFKEKHEYIRRKYEEPYSEQRQQRPYVDLKEQQSFVNIRETGPYIEPNVQQGYYGYKTQQPHLSSEDQEPHIAVEDRRSYSIASEKAQLYGENDETTYISERDKGDDFSSADPVVETAIFIPVAPPSKRNRKPRPRPRPGAPGKKRLQPPSRDKRVQLGQSLVTRLWHVLHTPV